MPRATLVDLDPGLIDFVMAAPTGNLFRPENIISSHTGAGNCWAKGFYSGGAEIIDSSMEIIRKEAEKADGFQGFQMMQSLGGGTGSGLGSLLL